MEQPNPDKQVLIIPAQIFNSMISHCHAGYPDEACGILAGRNMIVSEIFMMTNTERSPSNYLMDPEEQFRMMKELRERVLDMTAIYHSHPASPAYPSPKDIEMAYYSDSVYLIVGLTESETVVRGFLIEDGKAEEIGISVV
jgi:proteasome lid subunit RPN8/RPN11